ncbi:hypothetical protein [Pontiella agarivorans]|uniref:Uncharacterized protein n=1 Tax=Pontiella agarivorans TaxID=3038953 RepID=A0ABU5MVI9_9BACT|nr:hypothetical protein [Pontiella agarivorans]MDZ8118203.1 hypothetical protein [Pontiella agarivorans]
MKKIVKALNDKGIQLFRDYLYDLKSDPGKDIPISLLDDTALTISVDGYATVEDTVAFSTRLDAGKYLFEALGLVSDSELENTGMWAWLSLFFFDQVCPANGKGLRSPGQDYRYIPSGGFGKGAHRHLLKIPFMIYKTHRMTGRVLLVSDLTKPGNINEEVVSRQKLISNPSIVEVLDLLYYDKNLDRVKKGIDDKKKVLTKKGSLRRFVQVINQFELTYDLYSMNSESIVSLLPEDFDSWLYDES